MDIFIYATKDGKPTLGVETWESVKNLSKPFEQVAIEDSVIVQMAYGWKVNFPRLPSFEEDPEGWAASDYWNPKLYAYEGIEIIDRKTYESLIEKQSLSIADIHGIDPKLVAGADPLLPPLGKV